MRLEGTKSARQVGFVAILSDQWSGFRGRVVRLYGALIAPHRIQDIRGSRSESDRRHGVRTRGGPWREPYGANATIEGANRRSPERTAGWGSAQRTSIRIGIRTEAGDALRSMIDRVALTPDPHAPNGIKAELHGDLAGILRLTEGSSPKEKLPADGVAGSQSSVVAGKRNQRYLQMLGSRVPQVCNARRAMVAAKIP